MIVFNFLLTLLVLVLMLPVFFLFLEVIAAVFLVKPIASIDQRFKTPLLAVLIPAHNESLVISKTIQSLLSQPIARQQVLVVADNCDDDTASIARELGVNVVERTDKNKRGKGYALDFGLQQLKNTPPEVVVVIDADCIVSSGTIEKLACACAINKRPIQSLYLMEALPNPSLKAKVATFAWIVKNKVRPLGARFMDMPCQLMGTGMAFLWDDLIKSNLASGHIVEDMKLGVDLARMKKSPMFLPDALVTSVFPPTAEATKTQRARWEHGHISVILNEAPALLFEAIKTRNFQMLALGCDLVIPPLSVLTLICFTVFFFSYALSIQPALALSSILVAALSSAILLAWFYFGREIISFKQLCYAPIYALFKIPLYIKFFLNRQVDWVRSKRD